MKGKRLLLAVMAVTLSGGVAASEIYKWTDENGNVHYEDRPSGAATEQRLALSYSRSNNSAVQNRVQARLDRQAEREEARAAADEEERAAEAKRADAEVRKEMCAAYREQLEIIGQARPVYRVGDDGERQYLDDAQRQEVQQQAEQLIADNCN